MFSCGTEAMDWISLNCERCTKYDADSMADTTCDFSNKIALGFFGVAPTKEEGKPYNCDGNPSSICSQIVLRGVAK